MKLFTKTTEKKGPTGQKCKNTSKLHLKVQYLLQKFKNDPGRSITILDN